MIEMLHSYWNIVTEYVAYALIAVGSFFTLVSAIGIYRMPDLYTRMHAASITDTAGAGFLILGMSIYAGFGLVTLKLIAIYLIFLYTSPVVTHALAQAALHDGVKPLLASEDGALVEGSTEPAASSGKSAT